MVNAVAGIGSNSLLQQSPQLSQNHSAFTQALGYAYPAPPGGPGGTNGTNGTNPDQTPPPPPITVDSDLDNAIKELLAEAEKELKEAQDRLKKDQDAEQTTQDQINALEQDMAQNGVNGAKLARLKQLKAKLAAEQQQVQNDQQQVYNAQAKVDACKAILYSDQADADQQAQDAAYNELMDALNGSGIHLKNGETLTPDQIAKLNAQQRAAYDKYLQALSKKNADIAAANQAWAELQLFASDPGKYGSAASDAIDAVNDTLAPLGYYINGPDPIDPTTAQQNLDQAKQDADFWNAALSFYQALVADDDAAAKVNADYQQLAAYRKRFGRLADANPDEALMQQLQQDQITLAQADKILNQAGDYFNNVQLKMLQQQSSGLRKELGIELAQENLADAEANLAAIEKLPPNLRQAELADAEAWVAQAKQQLYDAQHGKFDITQFSNQELATAIAKVKANHKGEGVDDLIDALGGQFTINQELNLIQTGQIYLTPEEQALAKKDPVTLAFILATGVSLNPADYNTTNPNAPNYLSPQDLKLMTEDPMLFVFMKLGGVSITGGPNGSISITVNGKPFDASTDPLLQEALLSKDPAAIMAAMMRYIKLDNNIKNLMSGTQFVRLDYVEAQMQLLMGGKNPTDQQAQEALQLLTTNMNAAFSPQEREEIWQEAGLPYFKPYLDAHFDQLLNNPSPNLPDAGSSGIAADKLGKWLKGLLSNANYSPEFADLVLDTIKNKYNSNWNLYVNAGTSSPRGTNFYEALSMAVQFDPTRAQEFAQWLTAPGKNGVSILQSMSDQNFFSVRNAILDGYGALSQAIYGDLKNDKSYTAQMFDTTFTYAMQDAKNAQNSAYANTSFGNFNPNKDLPAYFNQFKGNQYIGQAVQISNDTQLRDIIGATLGLTPTNNQAALDGDYTQEWYAEGTVQREIIDLIVGWIHKEGGNNPTITALPMVYAAPGEGVQYGALFQVQTTNGQTVFVDGLAAEEAIFANNGKPVSPNADIGFDWHYKSLSDYEDNNQLSRDGTIYFPKNPILPSGGTYGSDWVSYQAHNWTWKDTLGVVRDVGAVVLAIGITALTAGAGAPIGLAILAGGVVGFEAFEEIDAAENLVTLAQGGDINHQQHISLLAPLTNNFGLGGVTKSEWEHAGIDATVDAITSFSAAAGTAFGAAQADAIYQSLAANGSRLLFARMESGAAGMFINQAIMGGGQFIGTGLDVGYQLSQGRLTDAQAGQELGAAFEGYLFNLVTSPLVGAIGGAAGSIPGPKWVNIAAQTGINFGTNFALTAGNDLLTQGRFLNGADWASVILNTISGTAIHLAGEYGRNSANGASPYARPGYTTVTEEGPLALPEARIVDSTAIVLPLEDETPLLEPNSSGARPNMPMVYNAANGVEGTILRLYGPYIPADIPVVTQFVIIADDTSFANAYRAAGGEGDPSGLDAFIVQPSNGDYPIIEFRAKPNSSPNANALTLAHELFHYYSNPEFRQLAKSIEVLPGQPYSNLSEGAAEFLASQSFPELSPGPSGRPYALEAGVVKAIFQEMGADAFYRAYFQGDPAAIASFKDIALRILGPSALKATPQLSLVEASVDPYAQFTAGLNDLDRQVAAAEGRVNGVLAILAEVAPELSNLNTDVQSFDGRRQALAGRNGQFAQQVTGLNSDVPAFVQQIAQVQANLTLAAEPLTDPNTGMPDFSQRLAAYRTALTSQRLILSGLGDPNTGAPALISDLTAKYNDLVTQLKAALNAVNAKAPNAPALLEALLGSQNNPGLLATLETVDLPALDTRRQGLLNGHNQAAAVLATIDLPALDGQLQTLTNYNAQLEQLLQTVAQQDFARQLLDLIDRNDRLAQQLRSQNGDVQALIQQLPGLIALNEQLTQRLMGQNVGLSNVTQTLPALMDQNEQLALQLDAAVQQLGAGETVPQPLQDLLDRQRQLAARLNTLQIGDLPTLRTELQPLLDTSTQITAQLTALQITGLPALDSQVKALEGQAGQFATTLRAIDLQPLDQQLQTLTPLPGQYAPQLQTAAADLPALRTDLTSLQGDHTRLDSQLTQAGAQLVWLTDNVALAQLELVPDKSTVAVKTARQNRINKWLGAFVTQRVTNRFVKVKPNAPAGTLPRGLLWAAGKAVPFPQWHEAFTGTAFNPADYSASQFVQDLAQNSVVLHPLIDIVADSKASPAGFGARYDRNLLALLANNMGKFGRALVSIPSQYIASATNPMSLNASTLDPSLRLKDYEYANMYLGLPNEHAAAIDMAIGAFDPLDSEKSIEHIRGLLANRPGVFKFIQITLNAAEITDLLGKKALTIESMVPAQPGARGPLENFQALLQFAQDVGLGVSIRADVMNPNRDPAVRFYRETKATTPADYRNFDALIQILQGYPNLNVILTQTGLSRFVTADPALHFQKLGEALALLPNLKFDLSGDVVPTNSASIVAYRFATDPGFRTGLIDFMKNHPGSVLFGTGALQAENPGQYRGAFGVLTPLFADLASDASWTGPNGETGKDLLFKLLRGNYLDLMDKVTASVDAWTDTHLDASAIAVKDLRRGRLGPIQANANAQAISLFDATMKIFDSSPILGQFQAPAVTGLSLFPAGGGAMPADSFWLGLHKNGPTAQYDQPTIAQRRAIWVRTGVRATLSVITAIGDDMLSHVWPGMKYVSDAASAARGLAGVLPSYYGEYARLTGEYLFEDGNVNREIVTVIANRILQVGKALGIDQGLLRNVVELTAHFGSDYAYLAEVAHLNNWTDEQFKDATMVLVNIYQNRLDQALGIQATSLNALDPGTRIGRILSDFNSFTRAIAAGGYLETLSSPDIFSGAFDTTALNAAIQTSFGGAGIYTASSGDVNYRSQPKSKFIRAARAFGYVVSTSSAGAKLLVTDIPLVVQHPTPLATILGGVNIFLDAVNIYANGGAFVTEGKTLEGRGTPHFRTLPHFAAVSTIAMILGAIVAAIAQATGTQTSPTPASPKPSPTPTKPSPTPTKTTPVPSPTPTVLHVVNPSGAVVYSSPPPPGTNNLATVLGIFPPNAVLTEIGTPQNGWVEVSGISNGKTVTGWVQTKDVR